ncbi:MAG TPA: ABC transporter permease [Gaiellaceae bacterium]|nr:ABC transporter permease [Gaiellaceae bacterium]
MTSVSANRAVLAAQDLQRRFPLLQLVALVALFVWGIVGLPAFATRPSIDSMLVLASFLGIAAVGQTIVILIGGIDLSIPNVITAGNLLTTLLGGKHWSFGEIVAAILGGAVVVGAANGFLAHHFRVPALIITLGSGSVVVGAVLAGTHASVYGSVPGWFTHFVSPASTVAGLHIPQVVLLWIVITLVVGVVMHLTGIGRRLYATGANERAAELSLVKTELVWVGAFAASAVFAATAGILLGAWSGTGEQAIGDPYLFLTIAAVIVGGTSLIGARGDYWRTVLGSLILIVLTTNLVGHSYSEATQQIILGLIILAAVGTYGRDRALRDRV